MNFKYVGKGLSKIDSWRIVTGKQKYTADLPRTGQTLYGYVVRSPYPRAIVRGIDVSACCSLKEVCDVLTPDDVPNIKFGVFEPYDEHVLTDAPKYVGDEVAAVLATSMEAARYAASLIKIDYEVLTPVFEPLQAMSDDAIRIHDDLDNVALRPRVNVGDVDGAMQKCAAIIDMHFQTQIQCQSPIEPFSCLCSWEQDKGLVIQAPVQDPFVTQKSIARVFGLPMSRVRVILSNIGGGYGSKLSHCKLTYICAALALRSGKEVFMTDTHKDDFIAGRPRVPTQMHLSIGADSDGRLLFFHNRILADNGAYSSYAPGPVNVMATRFNIIYRIANIRSMADLVYTNKIPTAGMRGFGNISLLFALESSIDMLIRKLGMDPFKFRKKNLYKEGDISALGWHINSTRLAECIDSVEQDVLGWRKLINPVQKGKKRLGIGVACGAHVSSNRTRAYDGAAARVKLNEDGSITISSGDGEVGQGIQTLQTIIAAEVLDIDISKITVEPVDTAYSPFGLGVFADRGTITSGKAVMLAAEDVKRQMLEKAADIFDVSVNDITIEKETLIAADGRRLTYKDLAEKLLWTNSGRLIVGEANYDPDTIPLEPKNNYKGNPSTGYTFCAQAALVEVDTETGEIRVLRISATHDSGTIINPLIAVGQVQGAILQGIGFATMEELKIAEGHVLNPNLGGYKIPTFTDMPEINIHFVESNEDTGPFGAKGIGQTGSLLIAPTIGNAIYDATGIRLTQLPFTPERVWRALHATDSNGEVRV